MGRGWRPGRGSPREGGARRGGPRPGGRPLRERYEGTPFRGLAAGSLRVVQVFFEVLLFEVWVPLGVPKAGAHEVLLEI